MDYNFAESFVKIIDKYQKDIEKTIYDHLGVKTTFKASVDRNPIGDCYVTMKEEGNATERQLAATPLLRQVFKDARLELTAYLFEKEKLAILRLGLEYQNVFGQGATGCDLMNIYLWTDSGKITVDK